MTEMGLYLEGFSSGNWPVDETNIGCRKMQAAFSICKNMWIYKHSVHG